MDLRKYLWIAIWAAMDELSFSFARPMAHALGLLEPRGSLRMAPGTGHARRVPPMPLGAAAPLVVLASALPF